MVFRLSLTGRGPLHRWLRREDTAAGIRERINERYAGMRDWMWCERILRDTGSPVDLEQVALREDFAGDLARLGREMRRTRRHWLDSGSRCGRLYVSSNASQHLRSHLPSDEELRELLDAAEDECWPRWWETRRRVRIDELYLDGFGHFHQQSFGPVVQPVTVFYGPNEAGKSTLLAFIRAILFGFPPRFNSHYPPQSGGRHGGRIALDDDGGASYGVERYAGARGGLSITSADGPMSNAEAVMRRLTGNATADLFRNIFAFSLDELQAASSLNDSNGTIYSADRALRASPS